MTNRLTALLVGIFIVALATGPAVAQTSCTDGPEGPAQLCLDNHRLDCYQAAPGPVLVTPTGASKTLDSCSTNTLASTDICSNTAGGIPCLDTNTRVSTSVVPPLPFVTPTGMACAGKTDTTTSTATATGTGTFYSTAAQPPTCTVTATNTSTVTATNWSIVKVSSGIATAAEDATPANIGALAPNGVSCVGSNMFGAANGQITSCGFNNYLVANSTGGTGCTKVNVGSGLVTSCGSATAADVGADAAGTATSAVNAAVSGTTGYVPYFSSAHTIGNLAPYAAGLAATSVPITDGSGTLNSFVTGATGSGNTVTVSGGRVSSVSSTSYTSPNGVSCSGADTINATNGQITGCAVTGYVATSSTTSTPTASKIPIADGSATVNGWVTGRLRGIYQYTTSSAVTAGSSAWADAFGSSFPSFTVASSTSATLEILVNMTASAAAPTAGNPYLCCLSIFIGSTQISMPGNSCASPPTTVSSLAPNYVNLSSTGKTTLSAGVYDIHANLIEASGASGATCTAVSGGTAITVKDFVTP